MWPPPPCCGPASNLLRACAQPSLRAAARRLTARSRRAIRSIDHVEQLLKKRTALCLKVIDVSDFESGFSPAIRDATKGARVLVALTKTDLLPQPISFKDVKFMQWRLETRGLKVASAHPIGPNGSGVEELATAVEHHQGEDGRDVVVCGAASSGKSTLVRALSAELCRRRGGEPPDTLPVAPGRPTRPKSVPALRGRVLWDTPGLVPPFSLSRRLLPDVLAPLHLGSPKIVAREPLRVRAGETILLEGDKQLLAGGQQAGAARVGLGDDLLGDELGVAAEPPCTVLGSIDVLEDGVPTVEVQYFGPACVSLRVVPSAEAPRELYLPREISLAPKHGASAESAEAEAVDLPVRRGGGGGGSGEAACRPRAAEGGGCPHAWPLEPLPKMETFTGTHRPFLRGHGVDVAFSELGWVLLTGRSDVLVAPRCVRGSRYWCRSPFYGKHYALPECASHLPEAELRAGVASGTLVRGRLALHRSGHFGFIEDCLPEELSAGLASRNLRLDGPRALNRATHGDEVYARILPRSAWTMTRARTDAFQEASKEAKREVLALQAANAEADGAGSEALPHPPLLACGEVVGLARRGGVSHVATIRTREQRHGSKPEAAPDYFLAFPRDKRIPALRLLGLSVPEAMALSDQLLLVRVAEWEQGARSPVGEIEGCLGKVGDIGAESEAILRTHQIVTDPWTDEVTACLPAAGTLWRPAPAELAGRLDLREGPLVASIDPPGCVDIDDALHCHQVSPGRWEVGVHIADVSHFVAAGGALDAAAAARGTSTYLVDQRIDIVPELLAADLCSLHAQQERLAVSVIWQLDAEANVLGAPRFARSVICSSAALSYGEAQAIIDDETRVDRLALSLRQLDHLAQRLRQRRRDAGAFLLNGGDPRVYRSADASLELTKQAGLRVNELIEEFMVLANATVAAQIVGFFPEAALLRRHAPPAEDTLSWLQLALQQRGLVLATDSAASLGRSLDQLCAASADEPGFGELLKYLVTRLLPPAAYVRAGSVESSSGLAHAGLALPLYTHFTSPIRRYADQLVHRMLGASLGWHPAAEADLDLARLDGLARTLNERKEAAKQAGRDSLQLYTLSYFAEQVAKHGEGPTEDAFVVGLKENGVKLHLPRYSLDEFALVHMPGHANPFNLEEEGQVLRAQDMALRMLDRVKVRISVDSGRIHAKLKLDIVEPRLPKIAHT